MSSNELNKGKLVPTNLTVSEFADLVVTKKLPKGYSSKEEFLRENSDDHDILIMDDKVYKVVFEIRGAVSQEFAHVDTNNDGTINFLTYHFNGSAHWTEIVKEVIQENSV